MGTALHRWRRTVLAIVAAVAPIAATVAVAFPPSASAAVPAAARAAAPAVIPSAVPAPPSGWTTAFSDDFTGAANTPIDSNWIYDLGTSYPGGAGNWGTGEVESETNSTQNVYQDGAGHLVIKPVRDAQGNWTSGRVETARTDFAAPAGGQMEITASLQQPNPANGLGYWPAFWAMGANARPVGATNWPSIGELDIMEDVNALSEVSHTFHCGVDPGGPCNETTGISSGLLACGGCQSAFHTYSVVIDRTNASAEQLRFYTDNVLQHTVNQNQVDANTWATAVDHGFFAILNVAIGGVYPFNVCQCTEPTAATTSGAPMTVDYVAVYTTQQGGGQSVATPTFNPAGGTYASAQSVTLSDTTPGSSIRYTLDGSTPTASSTLYTGPITIAATTTVKAIGMASGLTNSATASATYTIGGSNSPDYTQSATQLNATQAQLSITPTAPAAYVDVHYLVNGGGQQNFRMTNNAGTWTQTVSSLTTGAVHRVLVHLRKERRTVRHPPLHLHTRRRQYRRHPAVPRSPRDRFVGGERHLPGLERRRRQHHHPLVQRVQRPPVAPGRPRCDPLHLARDSELGGGLRDGLPDPDLHQRHHLDADLLHDDRHRRRPDPHGQRLRPLCADVRHQQSHALRLLPVRVPSHGQLGVGSGTKHLDQPGDVMKAPSFGGTPHRRPLISSVHAAFLLLLALSLAFLTVVAPTAHAADSLLSQGKTATASSAENATYPASNAVDGSTTTRWSSAFSDPQWLQVDLGATATIDKVVLNWEAAYATGYQIQTSNDGTTWTSIYSTTTSTGGVQTLTVTGTGRYVRMYGTARATPYGYSLWEFQVYGTSGTNGGGGSSSPDYTQSATQLNATQAQLSITPTTPAAYVDVHYLVNGGGQQNFRMTNNAGTWSQTVSSLTTGTVLEYWFTYEKSGAQYDTPHFTYTQGGSTGGGGTASTPTFNPAGGSYTTAQSVTISDATSGASIRYTLDGSTPTASSTLYSGPISVTATTTVSAIAIASGMTNSPVASATYTIGTSGGGTGGSLGPNVIVISPSESVSAIASQLNAIGTQQAPNQFGAQRYEILFQPGTYGSASNPLDFQLGYYESVEGLGQNPSQVVINGTIDSWNQCTNGDQTQCYATNNFWRSVSNLTINVTGLTGCNAGEDVWAASQAAPMRRVDGQRQHRR